MKTVIRLLLSGINRIDLSEAWCFAVDRYQCWKSMISITLHPESKRCHSTVNIINTLRGKQNTIIVSNDILMKLPTSLCPPHLAVIPKLDLRHQTVNWREVIEITFWSWYLNLVGITARSLSFCTSLNLPGASSTVRTGILIHRSEVVKG